MIEEEIIEDAIADASEEVMNGNFTRSQLSAMLDKNQILTTASSLYQFYMRVHKTVE